MPGYKFCGISIYESACAECYSPYYPGGWGFGCLGKSPFPFLIHVPVIRIHHECEGGIETSVPRITDWHHETCRVMTNGDPEGHIFLSHPHKNNGFFFLAQDLSENVKTTSRTS